MTDILQVLTHTRPVSKKAPSTIQGGSFSWGQVIKNMSYIELREQQRLKHDHAYLSIYFSLSRLFDLAPICSILPWQNCQLSSLQILCFLSQSHSIESLMYVEFDNQMIRFTTFQWFPEILSMSGSPKKIQHRSRMPILDSLHDTRGCNALTCLRSSYHTVYLIHVWAQAQQI